MAIFGSFPGWDNIDGSSVSNAEVEAAFKVVMSRANALERYLDGQKRRRIVIWKRSLLAAAAAVALILVPALSIWYASRSASQGEPVAVNYIQCSTASGETMDVVLPDNSRVMLNSQSVLIYPESFGKERSVFLSGEAVFDVTASETSPFEVKTSDITVMVYGTMFDVNAYFDSPTVTATLNRGSVSVWPNDAPERLVKLEPEERVSYEKATGAIIKEKANSIESLSWTSGELCFRSASIHEIIRIVQRHYGVQVYLATDKYDSAVITARFIHGETVDELMEALCVVVPHMQFTHTDNSIYIK
ncbi:MAG: FecR domain-containing protein [Bacteroidales bacterium]|nr:FecR domain-containing protein [Bacteroidales bacterium]